MASSLHCTEEPALFSLIEKGSADAVKLYLRHFPPSLMLPIFDDRSPLAFAVECCFEAAASWEADNREERETRMRRRVEILRSLIEHDLKRSCWQLSRTNQQFGQTILHEIAAGYISDESPAVSHASSTMSCDIMQLLKEELESSCENSISFGQLLWLRNEQGDTALHTAILHGNFRAAVFILSTMDTKDYRQYDFSVDEDEESPPLLHAAIQQMATRSLLELITELFPSACGCSFQNQLALVSALEYGLNVNKLEVLVRSNPAAVSIPTGDGDFCLHLAALFYENNDESNSNDIQVEACDMLLQAYPGALYKSNCHGQWPLHCALESAREKSHALKLPLVQLLTVGRILDGEENHSESNSLVSPLGQADCYGDTPLHVACRSLACVSYAAIKWMLEQNINAAKTANGYGHLPLHLAADVAASSTPVETILLQKMLLVKNVYPQALASHDYEGDTPLQCAILHSMTLDINVLEGLLHPEAKMPHPQTNAYTIHEACKHGASLKIIRRLLKFHPQARHIPDRNGHLPCHIAALSHCCPRLLQTLMYEALDERSESVAPKDDLGPIPTESGRSTFPMTANGLPFVFLLCELSPKTHGVEQESKTLDLVRFLLERSPDLFQQESMLAV